MARSWLLLVLCGLGFAANQAPPYDHAWCLEGKLCSDNNQCKQPNGENGNCCSGRCRRFKLSRGELCGASIPNTACPSCDDNLKCGDSGNAVFKCEQQNVNNGCLCNSTSGACISTHACLPSGFCGAKDVAPRGSCEVSSQCFPNSLCVNTTCQPVPNGAGCGTPDTKSNLCLPGSICDAGSKCNVVGQWDDPCNADYECAQPILWCATTKKCANRTALGTTCSGTSCEVGLICSSLKCVAPRSVADNADCTLPLACVSGVCGSQKCTPTHFAAVGQTCAADLDCAFGASCQSSKCTPSGLNMPCDPTLGGGDMDKQCQHSNDLYCACSGICLATDAAIMPTGAVTTGCQAAKDAIAKLSDLHKIDISSLTAAQRTSIATDQCCRNCNKDDRVSKIGASINCMDYSVSQSTGSCGVFAVDPLALANCPVRTESSAKILSPLLAVWALLVCMA